MLWVSKFQYGAQSVKTSLGLLVPHVLLVLCSRPPHFWDFEFFFSNPKKGGNQNVSHWMVSQGSNPKVDSCWNHICHPPFRFWSTYAIHAVHAGLLYFSIPIWMILRLGIWFVCGGCCLPLPKLIHLVYQERFSSINGLVFTHVSDLLPIWNFYGSCSLVATHFRPQRMNSWNPKSWRFGEKMMFRISKKNGWILVPVQPSLVLQSGTSLGSLTGESAGREQHGADHHHRGSKDGALRWGAQKKTQRFGGWRKPRGKRAAEKCHVQHFSQFLFLGKFKGNMFFVGQHGKA